MENENIINEEFDTLTKLKIKAREAKGFVVEKAKNAGNWVIHHPEETVMLVGAGLSIANCGIKIANKVSAKKRLKAEMDLKDRYIYNRSMMDYVYLKKPKSKWSIAEQMEFERRVKMDHEPMVAVLRSMGMI